MPFARLFLHQSHPRRTLSIVKSSKAARWAHLDTATGGVRPSPAAASQEFFGCAERSPARRASRAAAPEDGRTPVLFLCLTLVAVSRCAQARGNSPDGALAPRRSLPCFWRLEKSCQQYQPGHGTGELKLLCAALTALPANGRIRPLRTSPAARPASRPGPTGASGTVGGGSIGPEKQTSKLPRVLPKPSSCRQSQGRRWGRRR